ncbi:MAG TPA: hypothetical protein VIK01_00375, partial [Polyangiaceae bacterium]
MNRFAARLAALSLGYVSIAVAAAGCGSNKLQVPAAAAGASTGGDAGADPGSAGQAGAGSELASGLGLACLADADCGSPDVICVRANHDFAAGVGAPPGGVCTAQCKADAECQRL